METLIRRPTIGLAATMLGALAALVPGAVWADAPDDVPEAAGYELVYALDIPDAAAFNGTAVPYGTDRSAMLGTFDRVAWYLEVQRREGPRTWIWVSAQAHSAQIAHAGVPHDRLGVLFQRRLESLDVRTNAPGIVERTDSSGGFIEFWSTNYGVLNAAGVPGASDTVYDFGDQPINSGGYGSMQVHDAEAGETLLAYNRWGLGGAPSDLGIGNNTVADGQGAIHTDWTFRGNAAEYTLKRLSMYARPGPTPPGLSVTLTEPAPCAMVQRQPGNVGVLPVRGRLSVPVDRIEARLVPAMDGSGVATGWQLVDGAPSGDSFAGTVMGEAGWYTVEVRTHAGDGSSISRGGPVGIGEIFVIAGQSNSANHGNPTTIPEDPRVCRFDGARWAFGADPQPLATGTGGSPWPSMGDALVARWGVPVGLVSVGYGGTAVDQWRPASPDALYVRLQTQLRTLGPDGFRAVLWHQGESDAARGTTEEDYAHQLAEVIAASRVDARWEAPWGIARAAYLPNLPQAALDAVIAGQDQVISSDPLVFAGPTTEDLLGDAWRYDGVHFNAVGLREHGRRWAETIQLPRCEGFGNDDGCDPAPDPEPEPAPEQEPEPAPELEPEPEPDVGLDASVTPDVGQDLRGTEGDADAGGDPADAGMEVGEGAAEGCACGVPGRPWRWWLRRR